MKIKTCKYCGAPIVMIKTSPNKTTPCDAVPVLYWAHPDGDDTIVTENGEVVTAVITDKHTTDLGYTPHKPNCGKGGAE